MDPDSQVSAERVRHSLLEAALSAYEDAAVQGLCCEGAREVAIGAMRTAASSRRGAEADPTGTTDGR